MDELQHVDRLDAHHVDQLVELYAQEWWSAARVEADVRRMLDATRVQVGLVDGADQLIAFARVVTDEAYIASLGDVIVRSDHRGLGLGDRITALALDHPRLAASRCAARSAVTHARTEASSAGADRSRAHIASPRSGLGHR